MLSPLMDGHQFLFIVVLVTALIALGMSLAFAYSLHFI